MRTDKGHDGRTIGHLPSAPLRWPIRPRPHYAGRLDRRRTDDAALPLRDKSTSQMLIAEAAQPAQIAFLMCSGSDEETQ
jgi:hypothetical protein